MRSSTLTVFYKGQEKTSSSKEMVLSSLHIELLLGHNCMFRTNNTCLVKVQKWFMEKGKNIVGLQ